MSTLLPFNSVGQYAAFGLVNQGIRLSNIVKQYITEHEDQMRSEGLKSVFIKEVNILPAVILTLRNDYKDDDKYWRKVREDVRKCGAEFVSNIYESDENDDIDQDYKKLI